MSPSTKSMRLLVALSTISAAFAFAGQYSKGRSPFLVVRSAPFPRNQPQIAAVIYGWDGEEEETEDILNTYDTMACAGAPASPVAAAVAESISSQKVGSLARLAVAFSPPERALKLSDIEKVDVLCVSEDRIEIEAVICEDGGCVSLAVPVSFPEQCSGDWLEGCVMRNLDELDFEAESLLRVMEEEAANREDDLEDLCSLTTTTEFPSWWVPPECDADLVADCDTIRTLLNKEDFQQDINALAQRRVQGYDVKRALVAAVGPAGLCLKVRAVYQLEAHKPIHVLDVLVPFGGEPKRDAQSLRAAVLGAVAATE